MLKHLGSTFAKGLLGILPLALSLYVIMWLFRAFNGLFESFFPFSHNIPGLGVITGLLFIYLLGLLLSLSHFNRLFTYIQLPLKNIPLVKSVYSAIEDLMTYFNPSGKGQASRVVKVKLNSEADPQKVELVGLLTQEELTKFKDMNFHHEQVAVFVPMSYALGGYTLFVPRGNIVMTDMKVEQAMKLALTSWIVKK